MSEAREAAERAYPVDDAERHTYEQDYNEAMAKRDAENERLREIGQRAKDGALFHG